MAQGFPINPEVLKWAREQAGYSIDEITSKYKKYPNWESAASMPSYSQLEAIALKFKIPIAVFFFPAPPSIEPIEKSLRSVSIEDLHTLSPQARFLFRKAQAFQIYLKNLMSDDTNAQSKKISWLNSISSKTPTELAKYVRKILDVSVTTQSGWKNSEQALDEWRKMLAKNGIYVFKGAFKNTRVSGFCIYDKLFPIIYLNNSLSKNRQIFTIFHELAHILYKQNYLDMVDKTYWFPKQDPISQLEARCNEFAGIFLVPDDEFKNYEKNKDLDKAIINLANHFKVSREVILRKYLNHGLVSKKFFQDKMNEWTDDIEDLKTKRSQSAGGDYYATQLQYLGESYSSLVFSKYLKGVIDANQAAEYLDVKERSLDGLEASFLKKEAS